jgi:thioredoxin-dependent peroxiredoxin
MSGGSRRLEPGRAAPPFELTTARGETVCVGDRLEQPLWLAFFRYAACPLCNFRIHQLMAMWAERFAHRSFQMVGVFQSPLAKLDALQRRERPPFTIVADPDMNLYRLYGVETSVSRAYSVEVASGLVSAARAGVIRFRMPDGPFFRIPADFLVAPGGTVHTAFYGRNMADHVPFETVCAWLDEMNGPEPVPPSSGTHV